MKSVTCTKIFRVKGGGHALIVSTCFTSESSEKEVEKVHRV